MISLRIKNLSKRLNHQSQDHHGSHKSHINEDQKNHFLIQFPAGIYLISNLS